MRHGGVLTKTIHSTMPARTCHALTEAGLPLRPVLDAIAEWSMTHLHSPNKGAIHRVPLAARAPFTSHILLPRPLPRAAYFFCEKCGFISPWWGNETGVL